MVMDDSMMDEIRVTVIATGIGKKIEQMKTVEPSTVRPLRRLKPEGMVPDLNYDYLQIPAHVRQRVPKGQPVDTDETMEEQQPRRRTLLQMITGGGRHHEEEDLSIPTFIRRQAD